MIRLRNVTKTYNTYSNPADRFKEFFVRKRHESFCALDDISLDVTPGQTVGIIGPNGSGKSTLLQVIAGILFPNSGTVEVDGKVSALLELGAGFNPDFTGEENVYLNASILGMSRTETSRKFDDIVEFAGIGDFISRPVKTYSSGMYVRLAFATAINVDPDVLIVDEALAVGDVAFQQKCMTKIKQLQSEGKTILFVSHDTSAVKSLCNFAVLMSHGKIVDSGRPDDIVNKYLELVYHETLGNIAGDAEPDMVQAKQRVLAPILTVPNVGHRFGSGKAEIIGVGLLEDGGNPVAGVDSGTELSIKVSVKCHATIHNPIIGFVLRDRLRNDLTATNTYLEGKTIGHAHEGEILTVLFTVSVPALAKGNYTISPAIADGTLRQHEVCDWIDDALIFEVVNQRTVFGMMRFVTEIVHDRVGG